MSIKRLKGSNRKTGLCKLAVEGELSIYSAELTKAELDEQVNDYSRIVIDLSAVEDMDTSGLQILLALHKHLVKHDKTLELLSPNAAVNKLLERFHMHDKLPLKEAA